MKMVKKDGAHCKGAKQTPSVIFFGQNYLIKIMSHVMRKPVFGVSNQVRLKTACSATETSSSLEILDIASNYIIQSYQ